MITGNLWRNIMITDNKNVTTKEIPIFFAIDDSYAPLLGVALHSAIACSSSERSYRAIILYHELSAENLERLEKLATDNFAVECVPMDNKLEMINDCMGNRLRCDYFTLTIYFRLFIPRMYPQYDKGIYIDSDVVLCGDLAELFDIDIGDNYIGACTDLSVAEVPELVHYMEDAVGVRHEEYINSGVLLMNMKKLRESDFDGHFLGLLSKYHPDCIAPDQDYINAMCNGKIFYLGEEWDVMPNENRPILQDAKLIHYNLFCKPWCYDGIQYGDIFWNYAEKTDYYEEIKRFKECYTDEKKKADSECLMLLVRRGDELPSADITFKKLHESGVRVRL